MTTVVLWLLISCDHSCMTLERFATQAECELARAEAVAKITTFYKSRTGCVRAVAVRKESP
jgi:hypothetical protein